MGVGCVSRESTLQTENCRIQIKTMRLLLCILLCFPPRRSDIIQKMGKKQRDPKLFSVRRKICMSIFLAAELKARNAWAAPQPFLRPEDPPVPSRRGWNNALQFLPLTGRRTGGREPVQHAQSEAAQATSNRWKASGTRSCHLVCHVYTL